MQRFVSIGVEELLLAFTPRAARPRITAAVYSRQHGYLPDSDRFKAGLFPWEEAVLSTAPFPQSGRYLVGGAGAGREVFVLARRGFSVVAFDPSPALAAAGQSLFAEIPSGVFVQASYADLVKAATSAEGPLGFLRHSDPFDAVIFGWASFSHVLSQEERIAVLRAVRLLAPSAPVLLSFFAREQDIGLERARAIARALLRPVARNRVRPDEMFLPWGGFISSVSRTEMSELAAGAGLRVDRFLLEPYPHAVLIPGEAPSRRSHEDHGRAAE